MRILSLSTLALLGSSMIALAIAKSCHAIAFSGGGSKGAYETGVIVGFSRSAQASEFQWDVASGVSAGGINSFGLGMWDPKDQAAMADWFEDFWLQLRTYSIYVNWPLGIVDGLFNKNGAFDSTPLLNLITGVSEQFGSFKRDVIVSAVDVNSGVFIPFTTWNVPYSDFPKAVVASASIPGVFPYMLLEGR